MVTVTVKGLPEGLCLEVTGHADWAPKGSDLVCAGVSVLTATLAASVTALWEQGKLKCQPQIRLQSGEAKILCRGEAPELSCAFQTIEQGYRLLSQKYPKNVLFLSH